MRYTTEQIKERAQAFVQFHKANDGRCDMLLMMLSFATGMSERECLVKIRDLAID